MPSLSRKIDSVAICAIFGKEIYKPSPVDQLNKAARAVASSSRNKEDCAKLLDILGIEVDKLCL